MKLNKGHLLRLGYSYLSKFKKNLIQIESEQKIKLPIFLILYKIKKNINYLVLNYNIVTDILNFFALNENFNIYKNQKKMPINRTILLLNDNIYVYVLGFICFSATRNYLNEINLIDVINKTEKSIIQNFYFFFKNILNSKLSLTESQLLMVGYSYATEYKKYLENEIYYNKDIDLEIGNIYVIIRNFRKSLKQLVFTCKNASNISDFLKKNPTYFQNKRYEKPNIVTIDWNIPKYMYCDNNKIIIDKYIYVRDDILFDYILWNLISDKTLSHYYNNCKEINNILFKISKKNILNNLYFKYLSVTPSFIYYCQDEEFYENDENDTNE